jgi:hypothetical protein
MTPTADLMDLWKRVLGDPPLIQQFELWACTHNFETIKRGITKTAMKNLQMGGTMSQDHRVRFASRVMLTRTYDPQKFEGQCTKHLTKGMLEC